MMARLVSGDRGNALPISLGTGKRPGDMSEQFLNEISVEATPFTFVKGLKFNVEVSYV